MLKVSTFAKRLKLYREESGKTLKELEVITGVPAQTLNRYELGQRIPKVNTAGEIAEFLGVDALWLQGYDVPMKRDLNVIPVYLPTKVIKIPVLGSVPAGVPVVAIQDILEWIDIPEEWTGGDRQYFGLVVKGDSMFPEYLEGDIVVIRQQPCCDSGDDCAVILDGESATLKRVHIQESGIELEAINPMYGRKKYTNHEIESLPVTILGVVVEQRRKRK